MLLVLAAVSVGLYAKLGAWQEGEPLAGCQQQAGRAPATASWWSRTPGVTEQDLLDFTLGLRTRLKRNRMTIAAGCCWGV